MSIIRRGSKESLPLPWHQQSIQIEISLTDIANKLASVISPDFPHGELLVDRIMGRMHQNDKEGLSTLYNSLSGFTGEIDFKVGQVVSCKNYSVYTYIKDDSGDYKQQYVKVDRAVIEDINLYSNEKLFISYPRVNSSGTEFIETACIKHTEVTVVDDTNQEATAAVEQA
jgi:hypothetical protein